MEEKISSDEILNWLRDIIKILVDHPEDIQLIKTTDERGVLYRLKLNPEDVGKVIGKKGNTVNAIRTILNAIGVKNAVHASLKLDVPTLTPRV